MLLAVLTDWCFAVYGCKFDFQKCYQKCYRCYQTEKEDEILQKVNEIFQNGAAVFHETYRKVGH